MTTEKVRTDELKVGMSLESAAGAIVGVVTRVERFVNGCTAFEWENTLRERTVLVDGPDSCQRVHFPDPPHPAVQVLDELERWLRPRYQGGALRLVELRAQHNV